ncbi:hypothetical protein BJ973_001087 [Actinoplanes tereljensis]|uniref:hypothetical protein n=1 Tax=Paractinoplanes tereljensis TaxID=571912 RepID=UPI001943A567|nr:hypothetical protein [Actinoplanes tereljensis]
MTDLPWDDVKQWFNPAENGSAPDVIVAGTTLTHWQLVLDLIRSRGWPCRYERGDRETAVPDSAADLFPGEDREPRTLLTVWPDPDLEWMIRPQAMVEILSDVDLHQIQGQQRLDAFCRFLRTLGDAVQKDVFVYSEGDNTYPPMMTYDAAAGRVAFLAGPW